MATGKLGLMVRVMGTSQPQPLRVQANFICKEIVKINPGSWTSHSASNALQDDQELEFVQDMVFQIVDHQKALAEIQANKETDSKAPIYELKKFRFNEALDAWILEVGYALIPPLKK